MKKKKAYKRIGAAILAVCCMITSMPSSWGDAGMKTVRAAVAASGSTVQESPSYLARALKEKPSVKFFKFYKSGKKLKVAFVAHDPDHAVTGGAIRLSGDKSAKLSAKKVRSGKNTATIKNLRDGKSCKLTISVNYNLGSKSKDTTHRGTITAKNRKVKYIKNAKASPKKVTASADRAKKTAVLRFSASVKPKKLKISSVVIGGKDYEAKRSGSRYTVKIPCKPDQPQSFQITHVVLSNCQQVKVKTNAVTVFGDHGGLSGSDPTGAESVQIVSAAVSNRYPKKGETVSVTFASKTAGITHAVINGTEYAAVKQANGYAVSYPAPNAAGKHSVVIESVKVNGRAAATNCEAGVIDVLKDVPAVSNLSYSKQTRKISVDISDPDGAMTGGTVTVFDAQNETAMEETLKKGENNYVFDTPKLSMGRYSASAAVAYDLDSDVNNGEHDGQTTKEEQIEVASDAPQVKNLAFEIRDNQASATFALTDEDKGLSALCAVLYDASGAKLETAAIEDLTPGEKSVTFPYALTEAGTYTVVIEADYKTKDGYSYTGASLAAADAELTIQPVVKACEVSSQHVEKGGDVTLTYTITDNTGMEVSGIVVDDTVYAATAADDENYTVTIKAPLLAGKATATATAVVYGKDTAAGLARPYTAQYEVLKDVPGIREYIVDRMEKTLSFQVIDRDSALIGGKIIIGRDESTAVTHDFHDAGAKSYAIPDSVLDGEAHTVSILLTYDRDLDASEDSANYKKDDPVRTQTIGGAITGEDVAIDEIRVTGVDKENKIVSIAFAASNDEKGNHDDTHIRSVYIDGTEYETVHDHTTDTYTLADDLKYTANDGEKQTFHMQKALLGNGTLLSLPDDRTAFAIFREKPSVDDLSISMDGRKVGVDYTLNDANGDIESLQTILKRDVYNTTYGIMETREIDLESKTNPQAGAIHVDLNLGDLNEACDFTVEVSADYDIADGGEHVGEVLGEQKGELNIQAEILRDSLSTEEDLGADAVAQVIEKKQKLRLAFEVSDNTDAEATAMEINGRICAVSKDRPTDRGDIYLADVYAPDTAGNRAFEVTKILYGEKEANLKYTSGTRLIRKEKPVLADYEDGGYEDRPYLKFTFRDVDNTLTGDAVLTIKNQKQQTVYTEHLQKRAYTIDLSDAEKFPDGIYTVEARASYNLSETGDKAAEVVSADLLADNVLGLTKRLQIRRGLHFKASLIAPDVFINGMPMIFGVSVERIKSGLKEANENGTLITGFKLAKVREQNGRYQTVQTEEFDQQKGSDKRYFIDYNGGIYNGFVTDWQTEQGLTYIYYESVTLSDGTEVVLDWFSDYTILKTYPSVTNTTLKEDTANNTVTATADIADADRTINRLRFRLRAADGRVLKEKFLNRKTDTISGRLTAEFDSAQMPMTTRYNLDVIVEYDAMGRGEYTQQTMGTAFVNSAERVVVKSHRVLNPYPQKGETVTLEYNLADNLASGIDIIGAVINGEKADVAESKGDLYRFEVKAPLTSGVCDYTATGIVLSNKTFYLDRKEDENGKEIYNHQPTDTVDVLKDPPYLANLSLTDDPNRGTAQFSFNLMDPDETLENPAGVAVVNGSEQTISAGENTITFSGLDENQMLSMDVLANYDLDSGKLSAEGAQSNAYSKKSVLEKPVNFMLLSDYRLAISDMKACGADGKEQTCFEKGTTINLAFASSNRSNIPLKQIVIDGRTYDVQQDSSGIYHAKVKGYADAGEHILSIGEAILENGKSLNAAGSGDMAKIEVLKDAISVNKLKYSTSTTAGKTSMTLAVDLKDSDHSLTGQTADIIISDAETGREVKTAGIAPNQKTDVSFETGSARKFHISIKADYKRTIADSGQKENREIYSKTIAKDSRALEMKSIEDVRLYYVENNTRVLKETVKETELTDANLNNYVLGVSMKDMPTFYSVPEAVEKKKAGDEDTLILKVSYEGAVDYSGGDANREYIAISFVPVGSGEYAYEGSFATLLAKMRETPDGTFTLKKDYDASVYTPDTLSYFGADEFRGTLDGNGHTIRNLDRPLFEKLNGAHIANLYLMNAQLATAENERATLAHSANNITAKHVFADTVKMAVSGGTSAGGLFLEVKGGSDISECSVTNLIVNGNYLMQKAAAITSVLQNSALSDCYAQGVINSGWWGNGGIAGQADSHSTIARCVSNVSLAPYFGKGSGYEKTNGGNIVGAANGAKLVSNISIADNNSANAYKICGGNDALHDESSGNYFVADTAGIDQEVRGKIAKVEKKALSEAFYKDVLHLDPKIWNLAGASALQAPRLKNNRLASPFVPDYDRVKEEPSYDASREKAYNNLYKLAPFYDASYILKDVEKIKADDALNTKLIQGIIPYNAAGKVVYALDTTNYDQIRRIRLVFTDRTMEEHQVKYDVTIGDVACYDITDLGLKYNYSHYIVNADSPLVDELVEELYNAGDYETALEGLTPPEDPYTYRWFYDEKIRDKNVLRDFVIKLLANGNYAVTTGNSAVNTAIREELTDNGRLMRMLYAYNYYMRWYNFDIGRFNVADMLMFKGEIFGNMLTFDALTDTLFSNPGSTMNAAATDSYYSSYLSVYTGIQTLPEFLNFFIHATGSYKDVNDWFRDHFKGELIELKMDEIDGVDIAYDKLKYRAWEHLSARPNLMLPMIMIPEDGAYIISMPTIMAFGSQKTYVRDIAKQKDEFEKMLKDWANTLKTYYNLYLGILSDDTDGWDVVENFNRRDDYINDTTAIYENPDDKVRTRVDLKKTKDVYYKWFGEPTGKAYFHSANYAAANGKDIFYAQGQFIGNMILFSHETAHNHDGPLYFRGHGRRSGTGAETYTTNFFTQSFEDGSLQINGTYRWGENESRANNLTPEEINTPAKIHSFYRRSLDTSFLLDYIAGEAFLELTSNQQAAIVSQCPDENHVDGARVMTRLAASDIEKMKLQTVDDLIANRLDLMNSVTGKWAYSVRWYEPHSATSVVSDGVFQYLAYIMLGYAGYNNGFVQYCGNIYKNDNEALQAISKLAGDDYKTFDEFRKGEFEKLKKKREQIALDGVDIDAIRQEFVAAMKADAEARDRTAANTLAVKKKYYQMIKAGTGDFGADLFASPVS